MPKYFKELEISLLLWIWGGEQNDIREHEEILKGNWGDHFQEDRNHLSPNHPHTPTSPFSRPHDFRMIKVFNLFIIDICVWEYFDLKIPLNSGLQPIQD